jgi:hypothetical protein
MILLNLHKIICAKNSKKKINHMPNKSIHTKHGKTCSIKLQIFITIIIKQIFISIMIFFNVAKKTCKCMNLRALIMSI